MDLHSPIPHCPNVNCMLNCGAFNSYAGKNSHSRPMTAILLKGLFARLAIQGSHHPLTDKSGLMHLTTNKSWCWSWNSNTLATWCKELTHRKRPWCWQRLKAGGEGETEDEMVECHHWFNRHESNKQSLGDDEGQGSLVCSSSWDHSLNYGTTTIQFSENYLLKRLLFSYWIV